jgi:hypothetical protein
VQTALSAPRTAPGQSHKSQSLSLLLLNAQAGGHRPAAPVPTAPAAVPQRPNASAFRESWEPPPPPSNVHAARVAVPLPPKGHWTDMSRMPTPATSHLLPPPAMRPSAVACEEERVADWGVNSAGVPASSGKPYWRLKQFPSICFKAQHCSHCAG